MTAISREAGDYLLAEAGTRWRITAHRRSFSANPEPARTTGIAEITDARSRRLEIGWNAPAKLTFTVDGRSPSADPSVLAELSTDVMAWRWDPVDGRDHLAFRGLLCMSEDTLSAEAHSVNYTALSYDAMLGRRLITTGAGAGVVYTQADQDDIVTDLLRRATTGMAAGGAPPGGPAGGFVPGANLPLRVALVNPDGTTRAAKSGQLRDRTYTGGSPIGPLITDLAACAPVNATGAPTAFDYDVLPQADTTGWDQLRIFYPSRGETRADLALVYGSTLSALTRSINSGEYGNYVRILGQGASTDGAPQLFAETWNADANNVGAVPVGLWQTQDNASDVSIQATLNDKAAGMLATDGVISPSYSLTLRPGWYRPGFPNVGDTVALVVRSPPRLDVATTIRVVGLSFAIGDDGQEDVELAVGRPAVPLDAMFRKLRRDVNALARR